MKICTGRIDTEHGRFSSRLPATDGAFQSVEPAEGGAGPRDLDNLLGEPLRPNPHRCSYDLGRDDLAPTSPFRIAGLDEVEEAPVVAVRLGVAQENITPVAELLSA